MAKSEIEILQLLMKLIGHKTGELSKVEYFPQKPVFPDHVEGETNLPRSTPEEQGVDSAFLEKLFRALYEKNSCHMHKVMAVKNGHVISECAFKPFDMDTWHITHSMCKSVTGMAIGFLITEGKLKLDDKVEDIFRDMRGPLSILFSNGLMVKHLLTMTSGVSFNEQGAVCANDWRKEFLESQIKTAPGSSFEYNSMNSYMLSAIVTHITGESMFDYLKPRLFDPLGIKRVFWETCPQKITKGGWGMYLRLEDMAKLGQLYINGGVYDGKQVLPEEWVNEAVKMHIPTGETTSPGYGFQLWNSSTRLDSYTFNGMLGQNVYVYPDINMMIVTNAGNEDLFQKGNMSHIIYEYMSGIEVSEGPIELNSEVIKKQNSLKNFIGSVSNEPENTVIIPEGGWSRRNFEMSVGKTRPRSMSSKCGKRSISFRDKSTGQRSSMSPDIRSRLMKSLSGVYYDMDDTGVGFMPLLIQIMHNNYTDGIKQIGFEYDDRTAAFYLIVREGDAEHRIKCGLDGRRAVTDIDEHGEIYRIACVSEFSTDEYGRPVLRNELYFLEDSTTRVMNIYMGKREPLEHDTYIKFGKDGLPQNIGIRFDEVPGSGMLFSILDQFGSFDLGKGMGGFVINKLTDAGAIDALTLAIKDTVRPKLHGKLHIETPDTETGVTDSNEGNSGDSTQDVGNNDQLEYDVFTDNDAVMEDD